MLRGRNRRAVRRPGAAVALVVLTAPALVACASASRPSPPAGVDLLTVPTPSVSPDDFVEEIDNPWLPLEPGATWTYQVTGSAGAGAGTLTVTVRSGTETVAGVAATVVDRAGPGGEVTDYYAQDRSGNVWWLGRADEWVADEDGAEAGLAMPRTPREGDGWREALLDGVVDDRATVTSLEARATTPAGPFEELLEVETSSELDPDSSLRQRYARGVGLVEEISTQGPTYIAELLSGP